MSTSSKVGEKQTNINTERLLAGMCQGASTSYSSRVHQNPDGTQDDAWLSQVAVMQALVRSQFQAPQFKRADRSHVGLAVAQHIPSVTLRGLVVTIIAM